MFSFRVWPVFQISTHAPAGGATFAPYLEEFYGDVFLLTPLREGRHQNRGKHLLRNQHFYSRPCGRGDKRSERNDY